MEQTRLVCTLARNRCVAESNRSADFTVADRDPA